MLNVYFGLFLFGLLCFFCGSFLYRAFKMARPMTVKDLALLTALSVGSLIALSLGLERLGYPPLLINF